MVLGLAARAAGRLVALWCGAARVFDARAAVVAMGAVLVLVVLV